MRRRGKKNQKGFLRAFSLCVFFSTDELCPAFPAVLAPKSPDETARARNNQHDRWNKCSSVSDRNFGHDAAGADNHRQHSTVLLRELLPICFGTDTFSAKFGTNFKRIVTPVLTRRPESLVNVKTSCGRRWTTIVCNQCFSCNLMLPGGYYFRNHILKKKQRTPQLQWPTNTPRH